MQCKGHGSGLGHREKLERGAGKKYGGAWVITNRASYQKISLAFETLFCTKKSLDYGENRDGLRSEHVGVAYSPFES